MKQKLKDKMQRRIDEIKKELDDKHGKDFVYQKDDISWVVGFKNGIEEAQAMIDMVSDE